MPLLFIFIVVPIFEIYLLIQVGGLIGGWTTILLVFLTAIIGTYLLRSQGMATLQKVKDSLQQGQLPTIALLEGIIILIGGASLLTPGFFTDTLGFICLMPIFRLMFIKWLSKRLTFPNFKPRTPASSAEPLEGECWRDEK